MSAEKSNQLVAVVGNVNADAIELFVAGEIIAVADKSISQIDESQVLVQPADAVYNEVGQEDGVETEELGSEKSENLSMTVHLSYTLCDDKLARSDSGSAVVEEDNSVSHKKFKISENVEFGSSGHLETKLSSPELPHKLPARYRQEDKVSDEESDEIMDGVHTCLGLIL